VFPVNNVTGEGSGDVKNFIGGKLCAFTGNTGVGKSSLLNCMFPELKLSTGEISKKLGRGRHTTRHVELFRIPDGGYIADTPGFSRFDTNRYDIIFKDKLSGCFREFAEFEGDCRFPDCSHTVEKGCAVIAAVEDGRIPKSRHESYVEMYNQAKQLKEWEYK
jgi:ribosome biogenesis GTPase